MRVDPQGMVLAQHLAQLIRDSLGQHHRHPGADADDLHRRDLAQPRQHHLKMLRGHRQRVAARDDHVADLRVLLQVGGDLLETPLGDAGLPRSGDSLARAMPAIRGAHGRRDDQGAVRVTVDHPGDRHVLTLLQGIGAQERRVRQFLNLRHAHLEDGVGAIRAANQRGVVGRDRHGILGRHRSEVWISHPARKGRRQLLRGSNAIGHLPAPVIPSIGPASHGLNRGGCDGYERRFVVARRTRRYRHDRSHLLRPQGT